LTWGGAESNAKLRRQKTKSNKISTLQQRIKTALVTYTWQQKITAPLPCKGAKHCKKLTICSVKISNQKQKLGNKMCLFKAYETRWLNMRTTESSWARKST
jgi:hypothetical protein